MVTAPFAHCAFFFFGVATAFFLAAGLADEVLEGPRPFTSLRCGKQHFLSLCNEHSFPAANLAHVGL